MNTQLQTTTTQEVATHVDDKLLIGYLDAMGMTSKLNPSQKQQFLQIAQAYQLNPFKREIYCSKYGEGQYENFSIIVGYEVYLKRAERSGKLSGWKASIDGTVKDGDLRASVTIYRKDWGYPFEHEVYYSEYVQTTRDRQSGQQRPNKMWAEKPITMTKKVAIAQAFRMAFPDELGGIPYTSDELPNVQEIQAQVVETVPVAAEPAEPEAAEEFTFDAVDHFEDLIRRAKTADDLISIEGELYASENLPKEEKGRLMMKVFPKMISIIQSATEANAVQSRIAGWGKHEFLTADNMTDLLNRLIEHAKTFQIVREGKKFVAPTTPVTENTETILQ